MARCGPPLAAGRAVRLPFHATVLLHQWGENANGVPSASPGLRGTSYPGCPGRRGANPEGVESIVAVAPQDETLSGLMPILQRPPGWRAARNPGLADGTPLAFDRLHSGRSTGSRISAVARLGGGALECQTEIRPCPNASAGGRIAPQLVPQTSPEYEHSLQGQGAPAREECAVSLAGREAAAAGFAGGGLYASDQQGARAGDPGVAARARADRFQGRKAGAVGARYGGGDRARPGLVFVECGGAGLRCDGGVFDGDGL